MGVGVGVVHTQCTEVEPDLVSDVYGLNAESESGDESDVEDFDG